MGEELKKLKSEVNESAEVCEAVNVVRKKKGSEWWNESSRVPMKEKKMVPRR